MVISHFSVMMLVLTAPTVSLDTTKGTALPVVSVCLCALTLHFGTTISCQYSPIGPPKNGSDMVNLPRKRFPRSYF